MSGSNSICVATVLLDSGIPEISERGWITGVHQHMLDPDDPWPEGYKVNDTWGQAVK